MALKSYRDLKVWQLGMQLAEDAYRVTKTFPDEERFGLTSQLRRAAVSIPANVAEGYGRIHRGDYVRHLSVARGSLLECETFLALAVRLKLVRRDEIKGSWKIAQDLGKALNALIHALGKQGEPT